jgi:hypothetical protein
MHGHSYRSRFISITQARANGEAIKKRFAGRILRSIVLERGFYCEERCETVCHLTRIELIGLAGPIVQVCDVPDVERGEVLVDSRDEGSF